MVADEPVASDAMAGHGTEQPSMSWTGEDCLVPRGQ